MKLGVQCNLGSDCSKNCEDTAYYDATGQTNLNKDVDENGNLILELLMLRAAKLSARKSIRPRQNTFPGLMENGHHLVNDTRILAGVGPKMQLKMERR